MGYALVARAAVLAFVAASILAQRSPIGAQGGTALLGRVVQASNDSIAIPRARITVSSAGTTRATVYSDDEGRFSIEPAPGLTLTITRAGFVTHTVRLDRSPSAPIEIRLAAGRTITGVAIDSQGHPAVAAAVRIMPVASAKQPPGSPDPITVYTNDLGEFRAAGLAPGRYEVRTARDLDEHRRLRTNEVRLPISGASFHGTPLLNRSPVPSQPLVVNVEENSLHVTLPYGDISLEPPHPSWTGTIDGHVSDERGRPAEGIKVRLWHLVPNGSTLLASQLGPSQTTDDLGHFRLFHVQAGAYIVETVAPDAWYPGAGAELAPVYYPNVTSINQGTRVNVTRGQEVTGVNIGFVRRRLARVYGVATDASGLPLNGTVTLFGAPIAGGVRLPAREAPARSGSFEFTNVAPGEYVLRATRTQVVKAPSSGNAATVRFTPASIAASEFGYRRITVWEADEGPVTVTTAPTTTLAGRIVFEQGAAPASPIRLNLRPVDSALTPDVTPSLGFLVSEDGRFEIPGFAGSSYLVYNGPPQWYVKSIRTPIEIKGFEPVDEWVGEITVVLSSAMATISGQVFDGTRSPVRLHYVLLVPVDEALKDQQQTGSLTADGRYSFRNVVPGDYYLLAFDPTVPGLNLRATLKSHGRHVTLQPAQELAFQTLQAFPGTQ